MNNATTISDILSAALGSYGFVRDGQSFTKFDRLGAVGSGNLRASVRISAQRLGWFFCENLTTSDCWYANEDQLLASFPGSRRGFERTVNGALSAS